MKKLLFIPLLFIGCQSDKADYYELEYKRCLLSSLKLIIKHNREKDSLERVIESQNLIKELRVMQ